MFQKVNEDLDIRKLDVFHKTNLLWVISRKYKNYFADEEKALTNVNKIILAL